jgi:hypothetical protein
MTKAHLLSREEAKKRVDAVEAKFSPQKGGAWRMKQFTKVEALIDSGRKGSRSPKRTEPSPSRAKFSQTLGAKRATPMESTKVKSNLNADLNSKIRPPSAPYVS